MTNKPAAALNDKAPSRGGATPNDVGDDQTRTRPGANALYLIVASLGGRLFTLLLLLYTTQTLKSDRYGNYIVVTSSVALFSFMTDLGLNLVGVRAVVQDRSLAQRYITNILALRVVFAFITIALVTALAQRLVASDLRLALFVYAVSLLPLAVSSTLLLVFQFTERFSYSAIITFATTVVRVALSILALWLGHSVLGLTVVFTLVSFGSAAVTAYIVYSRFLPFSFAISPSWWIVLLRQAAPFAIVYALDYLYGRIDLQILQVMKSCVHQTTCAVAGQYGAAYNVLDVLTATLVATVSAALYPSINRVATESLEALARVVRSSYILLLTLGVGVAVFIAFYAVEVMRVIGGSEVNGFSDAAPALAVLIWALPLDLALSIMGSALIALHRQWMIMIAFACALVFNVAFNILLIPRFSYGASAALTTLSELLNLIILVVALRRAGVALELGRPTIKIVHVAAATAVVLWATRGGGLLLGVPCGIITALVGLRLTRVLGPTEREVLVRFPLVGRYIGLL